MMVACAPAAPGTIPRVVDGEVEPGPFVSPYAYHWYIRGEVAATKHAYEGAAIAFEAVRASPSDDVLLLAQLALAYELAGERRQADRTLDEALRLSPKSARVWFARGKIAQARGQTEAAFLAYRRARSLSAKWDEPPVAIARLLESEGHVARAQSILETHLRDTPESFRARRVHVELAIERGDLDAIVAQAESDPAQLGAALARAHAELAFDRDMPFVAARLLGHRTAQPTDTRLLIEALVRSGQPERAQSLLRELPEGRLGHALDRARLHLGSGRPDLTATLVSDAQHLPRARYLLGAARLVQRRYAEACTAFASVPYGSRDYDRAMVGLVRSLTALDQEAAALELIEHARIPEVQLRVASAALYDSLGEHSTAIATLASDGGVEQLARARLLEHLGRQREANAQYRTIDPTQVPDRAARRRIHAERAVAQGRLDTAAEELRTLRRVAPEDLWARARLVEVLRLRGEAASAAREREALLHVAYEDAMLRLLTQ